MIDLSYPCGTHILPAMPAITHDEVISIRGKGSRRTRLIMPQGFDLTYRNVKKPPIVEGVTLIAPGCVGTALKITGPATPSYTSDGPLIEDVNITGEDTAAQWWGKGIHLVDCWYPTLEGVAIKGRDDATAPFDMLIGIEHERCMALFCRDLQIFHCQDGIVQSGATFGEGFELTQFEIVGVNRGIFLGGPISPGTSIHDGHINAYSCCIRAENRYQMSLHDLLLYKTHVSTSEFTAIYLLGCDQMHVHDNTINGSPLATGGMNGMFVVVTKSCVIGSNSFKDFNVAGMPICVGTASDKNIIADNLAYGATGTVVQVMVDAGTGNKLHDNWNM